MKTFANLPLSLKVVISTLLGLLVPVAAAYGYVITPEQIEILSAAIVAIGVAVYGVLKTKKVIKKNKEDSE